MGDEAQAPSLPPQAWVGLPANLFPWSAGWSASAVAFAPEGPPGGGDAPHAPHHERRRMSMAHDCEFFFGPRARDAPLGDEAQPPPPSAGEFCPGVTCRLSIAPSDRGSTRRGESLGSGAGSTAIQPLAEAPACGLLSHTATPGSSNRHFPNEGDLPWSAALEGGTKLCQAKKHWRPQR